MTPDQTITCSVTSDLMILYTKGRTSPETNDRIRDHLRTCAGCSRAFGLEPGIRGRVELAPGPQGQTQFTDVFDRARYHSLPAWGFVLFLATRALAFLSRFGLSTATARIRLYRARRRTAGRMVTRYGAETGIGPAA